MGLNVIPTDTSNLTEGEKRVLNRIKRMNEGIDRDCYLYVQPRLRQLMPDFILIDQLKGLCVIEVKDWSLNYLNNAGKLEFTMTDGRKDENPVRKSNKYYNLLRSVLESEDSLINEDGDEIFKIYGRVIFTNMSRLDITSGGLEKVLNQPPSSYITSDNISYLRIDDLFSSYSYCTTLDHIRSIRASLFPEIKIAEIETSIGKKVIKALDVEQEKFAKRIPYGHYMVTGIPGSGKTVILLTRALHLAAMNPDWKIAVVTYNRSLTKKLNDRISKFENELKFENVNLENISISTFHKLALDVSVLSVPQIPPNDWWREILPQAALDRAKPTYDAILIDEYQDFYDSWIKLCIKLCKIYKYNNTKGEEVEGINLFMAGDRLQSIYNPMDVSWKSIGIDMRGRSALLKRSYRTGGKHINLALDFLMLNQSLKGEVENFYEGRNDIESRNVSKDDICFVEGSYRKLAEKINYLINILKFNPGDILVLCKYKRDGDRLLQVLDSESKQHALSNHEPMEGYMTITTYHSSKGLEAPVCILLDVDKYSESNIKENEINQRKLIYVGATRASQILCIHASNFGVSSYAKDLKQLAENGLSDIALTKLIKDSSLTRK